MVNFCIAFLRTGQVRKSAYVLIIFCLDYFFKCLDYFFDFTLNVLIIKKYLDYFFDFTLIFKLMVE